MPRGRTKKTEEPTHQSLESKLWATADKLRGHLEPPTTSMSCWASSS